MKIIYVFNCWYFGAYHFATRKYPTHTFKRIPNSRVLITRETETLRDGRFFANRTEHDSLADCSNSLDSVNLTPCPYHIILVNLSYVAGKGGGRHWNFFAYRCGFPDNIMGQLRNR